METTGYKNFAENRNDFKHRQSDKQPEWRTAMRESPQPSTSFGGYHDFVLLTIFRVPSGKGRCNLSISSSGAVIHISTSSGVVRITGIASGWIAPTTSFASVVKKPKCGRSLWNGFAQIAEKNASGRSSLMANHVGVFFAIVCAYSQKLVHGTTQRFSVFSQGHQYRLLVLRIFVIDVLLNPCGAGIPHLASVSSRTPSGALRTIGAKLLALMPLTSSRFPVVSRVARVKAIIAAWPFEMEYRSHIFK